MRLSFSLDIKIPDTNLINKAKEAASFLKERVSSAAGRVIQFIQEKRPVVAKMLRSATVEVVAFLGISRIVKALLVSGPISQKAQSSALGWSGYWGHIKVMKAFLDTGAPILKEDREKAIKNMAIFTNSLEVLSVLLNVDPKEISQKAIEDAIKNVALNHDSAEIINALLATGNISEKAREEVIKIAAPKAHLNMVNGLLAAGAPISEKAREKIILDMISNARSTVGLNFFDAISYNNFGAILKALLANGPISDETRKIAIKKAAKQGMLNIVEPLFTPGLFSQQELEKIFEKTFDNLISRVKDFEVCKSHPVEFDRLKKTIDFILSKGDFSKETIEMVDCCYAIWAADIKKIAFYVGKETLFSDKNRFKIQSALWAREEQKKVFANDPYSWWRDPTCIVIQHMIWKLPYTASLSKALS